MNIRAIISGNAIRLEIDDSIKACSAKTIRQSTTECRVLKFTKIRHEPESMLNNYLQRATIIWLIIVLARYDVCVCTDNDDRENSTSSYNGTNTDSEEDNRWHLDRHGILQLNTNNFDRAIDAHRYLLVVFYKPSCRQCILLHPHYVSAWKKLQRENLTVDTVNSEHRHKHGYKDNEERVQFAMIDCSNETSLLLHYGVVQFPTLTFFAGQREKMYDGGYRTDDIVQWVKKRMGPPALYFDTAETIEQQRKEHSVVVVGFFEKINSSSALLYRYVADVIHDYPFLVTDSVHVRTEYGVNEDTVTVFRQWDLTNTGEDERVDFIAGANYKADELAQFLRTQTMPLLVRLNMSNVWRVVDEHAAVKTHFLLFHRNSDTQDPDRQQDSSATPHRDSPEESHDSTDQDPQQRSSEHVFKLEQQLLPTARKYRGQIVFLLINAEDKQMRHLVEYFGIDSSLPAMRLFRYDTEPTQKFRPALEDGLHTFNEQSATQFCEAMLDGTLKPYRLSQPLPNDWNETTVLTLVTDNYHEVVFSRNHASTQPPPPADSDSPTAFYTFVMLHAPWCSHCQRELPEFTQTAELYQQLEHTHIRFAKLDATANEPDNVEVAVYPTYLLYNTGSGGEQPVQCNDSHTVAEFIEFLNLHTDIKVDVPQASEIVQNEEIETSGVDNSNQEEKEVQTQEIVIEDADKNAVNSNEKSTEQIVQIHKGRDASDHHSTSSNRDEL